MRLNEFKKLPVMGILRGVEDVHLEPLMAAIISAGLRTIEFALNAPGALGLIRRAVRLAKGQLTIGAGTVLNTDGLAAALDAGATFIVSPVLVPEVVADCVESKIPVFPGALTPAEIYAAWKAGATMVKVFPTRFMGPEYLREIKGPFQDIELLACGGITPENIKAYFSCGASAVAFGGSIFGKERLASGRCEWIRDNIQALVRAAA